MRRAFLLALLVLLAPASAQGAALTGTGIRTERAASNSGGQIRLGVQAARSTTVRLTLIEARTRIASTTRTVQRGLQTLRWTPPRQPTRTGARLRISARHLRTNRVVRRTVAITRTVIPAPSGVNVFPTGLTLTGRPVPEDAPVGTVAGTLSAKDTDPLVYALAGGADDSAFTITGSQLKTAKALDFEAKASYAIRVRVSDGRSGTQTRDFTVAVADVDEPPVLTRGHADALTYTENDPAAVIDDAIAVADPDTASLSGATVTVSTGFQRGLARATPATFDTLAATPPAGITAAFDAATGVLSLTGDASPAAYQQALRSVTFASASDAPATSKAATFTVTGGGKTSAAVTRPITVSPVNDAPVLSISSGDLAYTENATATLLDGAVGLTDADSPLLTGATVTLGAATPTEALAFTPSGGIAGSYAGGVLTLSGSAGPAAYQAALRTVTYANSSDAPAPLSRTVEIKVTDDAAATAAKTRGIAITAVDDPPAVTLATTTPLAYTENASAAVVDGGLTVADPDSATLTGATVDISTGFQRPLLARQITTSDTLAATPPAGITAAYDAATGRLTLTGEASLAAYQQALRSVTFASRSDAPAASKAITFAVTGGGKTSTPVSRAISVTAVNDAPVVTTTAANLAYAENAGAVAIDTGLAVADVDSPLLSGATVSLAGAQPGETLALPATGGISGSYADGVLTLSGSAGPAAYQAALRSVTYANPSDDPAPLSRTIAFTVTDSDNASANASRGIAITAVNDPPAVTLAATTPLAYTENDPATVVDGGLTVTDPDSATLTGATVDISTGGAGSDLLAATTSGAVTGSYDNHDNRLTLSGAASVATYQSILRTVTYRSTSDDPATAKTIAFVVSDGTGAGAPASRSVAVTRVNDAPVVTTSSTRLAYTENQGPVVIDDAVGVSDVDSPTLAGATVSLVGGPPLSQDALAATTTGPITATYDASTAVLTLTGDASPQAYQSVLRTVTYANSSDNPAPLARRVTFQVTDGGGASGLAQRGIDITRVNDAPDAKDDTASVGESATVTVSAPGVLANDTDPDGDTLAAVPQSGATTAKGGKVDVLAGGAFTYDTNGKFESLAAGATDTDAFVYTVSDGHGGTDTATVTITVNGANDAPVLTASSGDVERSPSDPPTTVDGSLGLFDVDSANLASATAEITRGLQSGDTLAVANLPVGTTSTYADGLLTITGTDTVSNYRGYLRAVTFSGTATGNRIITFKATDSTGLSSAGTNRTLKVTDPVDAVDDAVATNEDTAFSSAAPGLLANDTGSGKQVRSLAGFTTPGTVTLSSGAKVTWSANGAFTYDPRGAFDALKAGATGADSFAYTISDSSGNTDQATVSVSISGVNDAPVAADDSDALPVTSVRTVAAPGVLRNDTDPEGDALTLVSFRVDNGPPTPAGSTYEDLVGTKWKFNADGSYVIDDSGGGVPGGSRAVYTVRDPSGSTATATLTVDFSPAR